MASSVGTTICPSLCHPKTSRASEKNPAPTPDGRKPSPELTPLRTNRPSCHSSHA
ncbi:hypothetical protein LZ32DRAFT_610099 [Colletotrichum eremochloae]|nr:hypothetical protein LZ32DRAFT_610099 [Colletotrichum eremochloae]